MSALIEQLLVLYIFIFLGWFFGKWKKKQADHSELLSFLLVNLFLPAKVFRTFAGNCTVDYFKNNYVTIFISIGFLLLMVLMAKLGSSALTKEKYEQNVYRYSLTISNYGYMGYVLVEAMFGEAGLTNMLLFAIPFSFYTYTFGYAMLTGNGNFFKKLLNPITFAIILGIGFGLTGLPLPKVLDTVLSSASICTGPVSMILTGLVLSTFTFKEMLLDKKSYVFLAMRLAAVPLVVFGVCQLMKYLGYMPDSIFIPVMMIATMPCGLNTIIFPKLVGEDCRVGARLAFLSHLGAIITIPVWMYILLK